MRFAKRLPMRFPQQLDSRPIRRGDAPAVFARGQMRFHLRCIRRRQVASRVEGDPFFPIPASHERLPK